LPWCWKLTEGATGSMGSPSRFTERYRTSVTNPFHPADIPATLLPRILLSCLDAAEIGVAPQMPRGVQRHHLDRRSATYAHHRRAA
jgi:hypothetical protein